MHTINRLHRVAGWVPHTAARRIPCRLPGGGVAPPSPAPIGCWACTRRELKSSHAGAAEDEKRHCSGPHTSPSHCWISRSACPTAFASRRRRCSHARCSRRFSRAARSTYACRNFSAMCTTGSRGGAGAARSHRATPATSAQEERAGRGKVGRQRWRWAALQLVPLCSSGKPQLPPHHASAPASSGASSATPGSQPGGSRRAAASSLLGLMATLGHAARQCSSSRKGMLPQARQRSCMSRPPPATAAASWPSSASSSASHDSAAGASCR